VNNLPTAFLCLIIFSSELVLYLNFLTCQGTRIGSPIVVRSITTIGRKVN